MGDRGLQKQGQVYIPEKQLKVSLTMLNWSLDRDEDKICKMEDQIRNISHKAL